MTTDPLTVAGAVAREVRSGSRDGAPTKIATARRTYPTDRADLWEALTSAERIPRWFLPVSGDLRVGGRYQLEGNAGGTVERCEQPAVLALTWEMGPFVSWLEVRLRPAAAGTVLELAHEAPVDPGMWEQFGPGAVGVGWDLALLGLGLHLESGAAADPAEGAAWPTTPEGTEFVRRAADGWAAAAAADGDDPAAAAAAAERTVEFYTVVPEDAAGT
ncbi:polyketide cyclase [Kineococcus sp. T13]|uniref:SRPBCC domain-containing protein n=1 Tax=Kineococcus vitellinus TaxID=2696565 RepID=UPI001411B51B|nr:SRPBCC domain-containing protein [Kineococcus vitellinus]NAZ76228.1 polyketide cyclase [Kineococcus vitellinus]